MPGQVNGICLARKYVLNIAEAVGGEDVEDPQWLGPNAAGRVNKIARNKDRVTRSQGLLNTLEGDDPVAGEDVIGLRLGVAMEFEGRICFPNLSDAHGQAVGWRAVCADQGAPSDGGKARIIAALDGAIGLMDDGWGDHGFWPQSCNGKSAELSSQGSKIDQPNVRMSATSRVAR